MNRKAVSVKNMTIGEGMPKICVPVMGNTVDELLAQTQKAVKASPDFLEWRADSCTEILNKDTTLNMLGEIRKTAGPLPVLFTFRSMAQGGAKEISACEYEALNLEVAHSHMAELIDVEARMEGLDARQLIEKLHAEGCVVIASYHCFDRTPSDRELRELFMELQKSGADILKVAVMPENRGDVVRLLQVTQEMLTVSSCPCITMAMGALGAVTRVSGETFGSCVTYASAGEASAPGQLPVREVRMVQEILHGSLKD